MGEKYRRISNESIRGLVNLIEKFTRVLSSKVYLKQKLEYKDNVSAPPPLVGSSAIEKVYGNDAKNEYEDFTRNNHEFMTDNDKEFKKRFLKDRGRGIEDYNRSVEEAYYRQNLAINRENEKIKEINRKISKENKQKISQINETVFKMEKLAEDLESARFHTDADIIIDLMNGTYFLREKSGSKPKVIIENMDYDLYPVDYGQDKFKMTLSSVLDTSKDKNGYQPDPSLGIKDYQIRCHIASHLKKRDVYEIGHSYDLRYNYLVKINPKKMTPEVLEAQRVLLVKEIEENKKIYLQEKQKGKTTKELKQAKKYLKQYCRQYNRYFSNINKYNYQAIFYELGDELFISEKTEKKKTNSKSPRETNFSSPFLGIKNFFKGLFQKRPAMDSNVSNVNIAGFIPWGLISAGLIAGSYFLLQEMSLSFEFTNLLFNPFFLFNYEIEFYPLHAFFLLKNNELLFWGIITLPLEFAAFLVLLAVYILMYLLMLIVSLLLSIIYVLWAIILFVGVNFGIQLIITGIFSFILIRFYIIDQETSVKVMGILNLVLAIGAFIAYVIIACSMINNAMTA